MSFWPVEHFYLQFTFVFQTFVAFWEYLKLFYDIFLSAMALVGGSLASKDVPAGLRVSFTETNVSAERKKVEENKKMEVAGNNEPLY